MSSKIKTGNSISGGKTSAYLAANYPADYEVFSLVCLDDPECAPKDKSLIQYVNAKLEKFTPLRGEFIATAEDDQTLVVMRDLEQYLGREIIWLRGKSFDGLIDERYERVQLGNLFRLPSWARRYCTEEMKLEPIFEWWFNEIGEKCNMRLGFRFDEFDRMERFFNNSDPTNFRIPVSCSTKGKRLQRHETFNWRFCHFPLIKDGITTDKVKEFWNDKYVGKDSLFDTRRKIEFPVISNCVGCFHKKADTLAIMWNMHPEKMSWFARQEQKDMGTWLDSRVTYAEIGEHAMNTPFTIEMLRESGASCDTGGCTD
jgi:hypothetical protein